MKTHCPLFLSCLFCVALLLVSGCGKENGVPPAEQENQSSERTVLEIQDDKFALTFQEYTFRLPQHYPQMFSKVQEAITNGNEAEADRIAQGCIAVAETQGMQPDFIFWTHLILGKMFLDAEIYDGAHRHLTEFAKRGGEYVHLLALCTAKSGDVDGGFTMLLDEIDRDPSLECLMLAHIVAFLREFKPSEKVVETINSLMENFETKEPLHPNGNFACMIVTLANYWEVRSNPERSFSLYERAIPLFEESLTRDDLDETMTWVLRNHLATLYSQVLDQHQKALEVVDNAMLTQRDNVILLNTKGLIYLNAGEPAEAIPVFQRAVALLDPPFLCVGMNLAYALHLEGRDAESRHYFDANKDKLVPIIPRMTKEDKAMFDALMAAHP